MQKELQTLTKNIQEDYYNWTVRSSERNGNKELTDINKKMIAEFNSSISIQEGRKYIKIIKGNSVWGFVVKEDDKKFKAGDILKAASYAAPARNKARGNIYENYTIAWTGPLYL